jgi:hypothetical protein
MHLTPDGGVARFKKNAHNLPRLLRLFISVRLALGRDLLFLRWLLCSGDYLCVMIRRGR